jgi:hypothetical protein
MLNSLMLEGLSNLTLFEVDLLDLAYRARKCRMVDHGQERRARVVAQNEVGAYFHRLPCLQGAIVCD